MRIKSAHRPNSLVVAMLMLAATLLPLAFAILLTGNPWRLLLLAPGLAGVLVLALAAGRSSQLRRSLALEGGKQFDGMVVHGILQAPGMIVLKPSELILAPVLGSARTVSLAEITSFRETTWFNGKKLLFRTGYWLDVPGGGRVGFAVANDGANQIRSALMSAGAVQRAEA